MLAAVCAGCQTEQTTRSGDIGVDRKQKMTSLVSSKEVEQQASQQYAQVLAEASKKGLLNQNPQEVQRVRAIADRLIAQVKVFRDDAPQWKWEVNVLTSKDVNAWCMPGGKIAVYTGLIEKLKLSDDELAAVMGHEIAHALREHARERMGRQMATQTATAVGAIALQIFTGVYIDPQIAGTFTQAMFVLPNSRENEQEADLIGIELAARAGYDPRAAITLWQKMAQAGGSGPPEWLSTHPSHETRLRELQNDVQKVMPLYEKAKASEARRHNVTSRLGKYQFDPGSELGCRGPVDATSSMSVRSQQQGALLVSIQPAEQEIPRVARVIGQIQLRGERPAIGRLHSHVDVGRPAGIRNRPDRAEPEVALAVGAIDAVTLEVRIALGFCAAGGMVVDGIAHRIARSRRPRRRRGSRVGRRRDPPGRSARLCSRHDRPRPTSNRHRLRVGVPPHCADKTAPASASARESACPTGRGLHARAAQCWPRPGPR